MPEAAGEGGSQAGGLLDSLKSLLRSAIELAQTRLQILGTELEEQRAILLREVLLARLLAQADPAMLADLIEQVAVRSLDPATAASQLLARYSPAR